jgi:anti-sigma-K factor RskA
VSDDPHRDPERLEDDLAAYALGALNADETTDLERHVTGCDACSARLRWLQPAIDLLPASVEQRTPPPRLRENLMEAVRGEAAASAEPARASKPRWWESALGFAMRPATAMAVAIVLVAGIGVGYLVRGNDVVEPETTLVKAQPLDSAVPVSATLERTGDSATLHVTQMPSLSSDDVYEVWVQRADVMEPRSTFVLSADGSAEAAVPGPLNGADAVLVTREPRGGSQQPTTEPLLEAPL